MQGAAVDEIWLKAQLLSGEAPVVRSLGFVVAGASRSDGEPPRASGRLQTKQPTSR